MRGNVDTRLRLAEGGDDRLAAIVLARAGLERLGRAGEIGAVLAPERFVPAPGQGVLALEGRAGDEPVREAVARICDAQSFTCLRAERALARGLDASCHTPLGAHAVAVDGRLLLRAWVGLPDGSQWIADELAGEDPERLGEEVAQRLRAAGGASLLAAAERAVDG
jgi:hydroxymethylbilane synthase